MRTSLLLLLATGALAAPPTLRLPDNARPVRYSAELTVDPNKDTLEGVIDIDINISKPTSELWLNGEGLTIRKATVGGQPAKVTPAPKDFVGLVVPKPLAAGPTRAHLEYSAPLSSKDDSGGFRQKEGDDWYAFTQFEAIDARRVFPSFDEPSYKTPWKLALRVPSGDRAFSNTAEVESKDLGNGWKRVQFAESKPLPSYLVAFAVGPFEIVDGGKSQKSGTQVRIIVPKGQSDRARWAAESSRQALDRLEEYFGIDYAFGKLDCVAVPTFPGAMENPGMVTFSASLILQKPGEETISRKRAYVEVATHEFAHQWFGDLVTTAWWDDIWLNEAFASWMTPKIIEAWQPTWGAAVERVRSRGNAMGSDELVSARQIRQPIHTNDDIKNAFDTITYSKGETVIAMFERFVGPEVFRRGVQRHLRTHANGNATAREFLQSISAEAHQDIAPAFSTFLDQPGVPIVSAELICDKTPHLHLKQARFFPKGSSSVSDKQTWQIPVCARWPEGQACTLLTEKEGDLALAGAKSCPVWVDPNAGGTNYYRAQPSTTVLERMEMGLASLTAPEKIALVSDLHALVRAGGVEYTSLLELAPRLAADENRFVVEIAADTVSGLYEERLISDRERPAYARYLRELFGARAKTLGWVAAKSDDDDTRLLRARILPLIADEGEDAALLAGARKLANAWLADHKSVDPDLVMGALTVTARHGDRATWARWLAEAKKTSDRVDRRTLLSAMASFRDPAIIKDDLALVLGDSFDVRESMQLMWGATAEPIARPIVWEWLQRSFDPLVAKLPRDSGAWLPWTAVSFCDDKRVPQVKAFFGDRMSKIEGGPRELQQALEELHLCAVFHDAQAPGVTRFFGKKK